MKPSRMTIAAIVVVTYCVFIEVCSRIIFSASCYTALSRCWFSPTSQGLFFNIKENNYAMDP